MTDLLHPSLRLFTGRRSFLMRSGGAVRSASAIPLLAGHPSRSRRASPRRVLPSRFQSQHKTHADFLAKR